MLDAVYSYELYLNLLHQMSLPWSLFRDATCSQLHGHPWYSLITPLGWPLHNHLRHNLSCYNASYNSSQEGIACYPFINFPAQSSPSTSPHHHTTTSLPPPPLSASSLPPTSSSSSFWSSILLVVYLWPAVVSLTRWQWTAEDTGVDERVVATLTVEDSSVDNWVMADADSRGHQCWWASNGGRGQKRTLVLMNGSWWTPTVEDISVDEWAVTDADRKGHSCWWSGHGGRGNLRTLMLNERVTADADRRGRQCWWACRCGHGQWRTVEGASVDVGVAADADNVGP